MLRMASFIGEDGKRYFTVPLNGRPVRSAPLTAREAHAMRFVGFDFARFDEPKGIFKVRSPYQLAYLDDRDVLIFMQ